jgi:hypothetical protein
MTGTQQFFNAEVLTTELPILAGRGHYDAASSEPARLVVPAFLACMPNLSVSNDVSVAQDLKSPTLTQEDLLLQMRHGTRAPHRDDLSACYAAAIAVARPEVIRMLPRGGDDCGFYASPYHPDARGCFLYAPIAPFNEGLGQYLECLWLPTVTGAIVTVSGMTVWREERLQVAEVERRNGEDLLIVRRWTTLVLDRSAGLVEQCVPADLATYLLTSWINQLFRGKAITELA